MPHRWANGKNTNAGICRNLIILEICIHLISIEKKVITNYMCFYCYNNNSSKKVES